MSTVRVPVTFDTSDARRSAKDVERVFSKVKLRLDDRGFTQPLGRITAASSEFQKSLEASNARVVAFAASAGILYKLSQAFDFLVKSTINVEKQLKDINVVLGATDKGLKQFGSDLFKIAAQTGQSFKVVADAATEFSRQGLSMEKTLQRTSDALILARLSGMDTVESTNALTAAVNSFSSAAINTTQVVNKLAAVDAAFAVSSTDLAESLKRSAASAQAAGVSLDELLALTTAVQERTARGGAVIGNSFKTIFTRIQRPEVLNQLNRLGVAVEDVHGKTLPAMRVMQQLAGTFDGLSDAQKSVTAEMLGGVFQVNNLRAALGDLGSRYSRYAKAVKISAEATNEANERNKELNTTLAAQLNALEQRATQAASTAGELTLKPVIGVGVDILGGLGLGEGDSFLKKQFGDNGAALGEFLGKGILDGLGKFLAGPGLGIGALLTGKLLFNFVKFTGEALKEINKIGFSTDKIKNTESQLQSVLRNNLQLVKAIERGEISRAEAQKQIIIAMKEQVALQRQIMGTSAAIAGPVSVAQTRMTRTPGRASGHIPAFSHGFVPAGAAAGEIAGAYASGYTPGRVRSTSIAGIGKVVYNSKEKVRHFPGMSQPAIIPPAASKAGVRYRREFKKTHGFTPANSGMFPGDPFSNLNAQRAAQAAAQTRLSDFSHSTPGYQRGIETSTGGLRRVPISNAINDKIQRAYQGMLREVEKGRMTMAGEQKARAKLVAKFNLTDRTIAMLDQAYQNEKKAVLQKVAATKKAAQAQEQQAMIQQQAENEAADAAASAAADKKSRFQNRAMIAAIAAPMIGGLVNQGFRRDVKSGKDAQFNAQLEAGTGAFSSVAGMAATGAMIGGGIPGAVIGGGIGLAMALPSLFDAFGSNIKELQGDLELLTEELQKVNVARGEFEKGLSNLEGVFKGEIKGESAVNAVNALLNAFDDLSKGGNAAAAAGLTSLIDNYVKIKARGGDADPLLESILGGEGKIGQLNKLTESAAASVQLKQLQLLGAQVGDAGRDEAKKKEAVDNVFGALLRSPSKVEGKNVRELFGEKMMDNPQDRVTIEDFLKLGSPKVQQALKDVDFTHKRIETEMDGNMSVRTREFTKNLGDNAIQDYIDTTFKIQQIIAKGIANAKNIEKMTVDEFSEQIEKISFNFQKYVEQLNNNLRLADAALEFGLAQYQVQSAGVIGMAQATTSARTVARLTKERDDQVAALQRDKAIQSINKQIFAEMLKSPKVVDDMLQPFLRGEKRVSQLMPVGKDAQVKALAGMDLTGFLTKEFLDEGFLREKGVDRTGQALESTGKIGQTTSERMQTTEREARLKFMDLQRQFFTVSGKFSKDLMNSQQKYINSLNTIRLANEKTFGGGIDAFASGPSAAVRSLKFQTNQAAMSRRSGSRRKGQAALQNLESFGQIANITRGGFNLDDPNLRGTRQTLENSLVDHYDQLTRGMGLQFSRTDLQGIAQSQINQKLKPDDPDLQLPLTESINDSVYKIYTDGIKLQGKSIMELSDQIAQAIARKGKPPAPKNGNVTVSSAGPSIGEDGSLNADLQMFSSADIRTKVGGKPLGIPKTITGTPTKPKSSFLRAAGEGFFMGGEGDLTQQMSTFGSLMGELGSDLRVGFKGALKEAIFEAESFSDALRSMAVNVLDTLSDKLFSRAFDAMFNAMGAKFNLGAKGGYVTSSGIQRFAEGGMVKGGSGFRDDVPAMLSQGEYVIRKSSVNKYGEGFLNALNRQGGGAVISASNRINPNHPSRATDYTYSLSPNLSALALTDENRPDVRRRRDLANRIDQNRANYIRAMQAYKQQQRGRLIQGYTSAAMTFAAYGIGKAAEGASKGITEPVGPMDTDYNGGFIAKRYASGGYVDDVPAMLMGGEMVMNRDAVNNYGRGFFEQINNGSLPSPGGMAEGGMVGGFNTGSSSGSGNSVVQLFDRLITSNESLTSAIEESNRSDETAGVNAANSSASNNITINVNVDKTGTSSNSKVETGSSDRAQGGQKSDEEKAIGMGEQIRTACLDVIINEKRPGGALSEFGVAGR